MNDWRTKKLTKTYLEGVRGAIPFANEQIELFIRIIGFFRPVVNSFLDLGCGDGILGRTVFLKWHDSKGIFLDFSESMIKEARQKCGEYQNPAIFIIKDFGDTHWIDSVSNYIPLDLVISGFSIHHQDNNNKIRIYNEIFHQILKPGGLFINLEHVASQTMEIEKMFDEFFIEHSVNYHQKLDPKNSQEKIAKEYYNREDKNLNILAPVEDQCNWLKDIGFIHVDCFFKIFELAIFGGVKPLSN
jgi:SAM-dependent methyltransferase